MDAILTDKAEQLATEIATQAKTIDDLNGLMKLMMKSALERMLDTELDVHLGRKRLPGSALISGEVAANSAAKASTKKGRIVAMGIRKSRRKAILAKSSCNAATGAAASGPNSFRNTSAKADRVRREDSCSLRQGDDHSRHPRYCKRTL